MLFYTVIMLLFLFLTATKQNKSSKKSIAIFCGIVLTLIMGFKGVNVGNDTVNYVYFFKRSAEFSEWYDPSFRFEFGYQIYSKIINMIFGEYQYLFIVTGVICIGCITYCINKYSTSVAYSFFLFIGLRFYYFFLSGLRQSIAVSIIFVAFVMLREKKNIGFILLVLLATAFHNSAVIFLLAFPLSKVYLSKKSVFIIILGSTGAYLFFEPLTNVVLGYLPIYYSHYTETSGFAAGNLANYLDLLMKVSVLILVYFGGYGIRKIKILDSSVPCNHKDVPIQHIYVFFLLISTGVSFVATQASMLDRLQQYFWIFSILSIPDIIDNFRQREKFLIGIIVAVIVLGYNLLILWLRPEWNMIVPYEFFWEAYL